MVRVPLRGLMGDVFESLRYRVTSKELAGIAVAAVILSAFAAFETWRIVLSPAIVRGTVVSTGPVSFSGACGATREVATVQLSDGRVVYALVDSSPEVSPGVQVSLQKQGFACGPVYYEVISVR